MAPPGYGRTRSTIRGANGGGASREGEATAGFIEGCVVPTEAMVPRPPQLPGLRMEVSAQGPQERPRSWDARYSDAAPMRWRRGGRVTRADDGATSRQCRSGRICPLRRGGHGEASPCGGQPRPTPWSGRCRPQGGVAFPRRATTGRSSMNTTTAPGGGPRSTIVAQPNETGDRPRDGKATLCCEHQCLQGPPWPESGTAIVGFPASHTKPDPQIFGAKGSGGAALPRARDGATRARPHHDAPHDSAPWRTSDTTGP